MTKNQRRRAQRARTRVKAKVTAVKESHFVSGFTRDISEEGLFILAHRPLRPGTKVEVELSYKDRTVSLAGVVIRSVRFPYQWQVLQPSGMGVKILPPPGSLKDATTPERGSRVDIETEVVVFFGNERHLMTLHDLSASGAAIVSDSELPEVSFIRMHVKLTETSEVMELNGIPVRSQPVHAGSLTGVRLLDPPDDVVKRIEAFVALGSPSD